MVVNGRRGRSVPPGVTDGPVVVPRKCRSRTPASGFRAKCGASGAAPPLVTFPEEKRVRSLPQTTINDGKNAAFRIQCQANSNIVAAAITSHSSSEQTYGPCLRRQKAGSPADFCLQLVELKNGETLNGHLVNCDNFMNITLREVYQTNPDGDRFWKLKECYIRGSTVRFVSSRCAAVSTARGSRIVNTDMFILVSLPDQVLKSTRCPARHREGGTEQGTRCRTKLTRRTYRRYARPFVSSLYY